MTRLACSLLALALASAVTPALAQSGADAMATAGERLQAVQAQAEAEAVRPGDDALDCAAMETEMQTLMSAPEMQAATASLGASAQAQMHRAQQARGQVMGQAGMGMAMGIASAFLPGLGFAQGLMMQAQMRAMQAQGEQGQRDMAASLDQMATMMPALMRGQRLYQLAQTQQCSFIEQQSAPAP